MMGRRGTKKYNYQPCPHEGACGGRWHGLCTTLNEIPDTCTFQKPDLPCIPNDICALRLKGLSYAKIGARLNMTADEVLKVVAHLKEQGFEVSGRPKARYATPEVLRTAHEMMLDGKTRYEIAKVVGYNYRTVKRWAQEGRI